MKPNVKEMILSLKVEHSDKTAAQIHAAVTEQNPGEEISIAEVKKLCAKLTKQLAKHTREEVLLGLLAEESEPSEGKAELSDKEVPIAVNMDTSLQHAAAETNVEEVYEIRKIPAATSLGN